MAGMLEIDRGRLYEVYTHMKEALSSLEILLADLGCLHANSRDVSTFVDKGRGVKKIFCPDCGVTFEEEISNGMETT